MDTHAAQSLVPRMLTRLFFKPATVTGNQCLSPGLHLITLEGEALRQARWTPGDKLQVRLGSGLMTRTYTPIDWDAARGRTRLLAQALAAGPGSLWVQGVLPGRPVHVMGPRRSLDLAGFEPGRSALLGDETAFGLAAAWRPARAIFEVTWPAAWSAAAGALDLRGEVIPREPDDLHLDRLAGALPHLREQADHFVLAGRARTVQQLLQALRRQGVGPARIRTKAHWAEGRTGLD